MTYPPIQQEESPKEYRPAGMREWKVGDRVRWRISAECDWKCDGCEVNFHAHCQAEGKGMIEAVALSQTIHCASSKGTLYKCGTKTSMGNHEYQIEMDEPTESGRIFWAAFSELLPLEPDTKEGERK